MPKHGHKRGWRRWVKRRQAHALRLLLAEMGELKKWTDLEVMKLALQREKYHA